MVGKPDGNTFAPSRSSAGICNAHVESDSHSVGTIVIVYKQGVELLSQVLVTTEPRCEMRAISVSPGPSEHFRIVFGRHWQTSREGFYVRYIPI